MKKLFSILAVLIVATAMLTACQSDVPVPTQDPAIAQLEDEKATLQAQLDAALATDAPEETDEPIVIVSTPTPTSTPEPLRCGEFVSEGKIYRVKANKNGVLQYNRKGKPIPAVLGKNKVDWFYKGIRTCVWKDWVQFDGSRMWRLWYNTWHYPSGTWLSKEGECCYVKWSVFKPDGAKYTLPAE
jgi:hypothetical protein